MQAGAAEASVATNALHTIKEVAGLFSFGDESEAHAKQILAILDTCDMPDAIGRLTQLRVEGFTALDALCAARRLGDGHPKIEPICDVFKYAF